MYTQAKEVVILGADAILVLVTAIAAALLAVAAFAWVRLAIGMLQRPRPLPKAPPPPMQIEAPGSLHPEDLQSRDREALVILVGLAIAGMVTMATDTSWGALRSFGLVLVALAAVGIAEWLRPPRRAGDRG